MLHLDRLNEELINEMYGKRDESQKKKQKTNSDIQINNADKIKEDLKD